MFSRPDYTPRVHDLLVLKPGSSVEAEATNPEWVRAALIQSRFVVARREAAPPGMIAVGVRGPSRDQRWAGFVTNEDVHQVIGPGVLRSQNADIARRSLPAIEALRYAEERLRPLTLEWGPVGSVGYELATGLSVTRMESDLDLVIYAPHTVLRDEVRCFWNVLDVAPARIDVRLETPAGGFSLEEYVRDGQDRVLLRMPTGPILTDDPWHPAERTASA
jgi:phosphoribosyl-dephospho-CoA transferase